MSLKQVIDSINEKEAEIKPFIFSVGKHLKLQDIVDGINFSTSDMKYSKFKEGDTFMFNLGPGYEVLIGPGEISFTYQAGDIKTFNGEEVEELYNKMLSEIEEVRKQGGYDLPF